MERPDRQAFENREAIRAAANKVFADFDIPDGLTETGNWKDERAEIVSFAIQVGYDVGWDAALRARLAAANRLAEAADLEHWLKTCMELVAALDKCKKIVSPGGMTVQANIANTSFVQVPYSVQLTINGLGLEIEAALSALSAYTATKGGE